MFCIIWKYKVNGIRTAEFEKLYGPTGKWVQLFQTGAGYVKTELLRDSAEANVFVTIDTWQSRVEYETFLAEHAAEFATIDEKGGQLTLSEIKIGSFEGVT